MNTSFRVASVVHPYRVTIGRGSMTDRRRAEALLRRLDHRRLVVVIDRRALRLFPGLPLLRLAGDRVIAVRAVENTKTLPGVMRLFQRFLDLGVGRCHTVVAVGGGITQDLAGFACNTYMRGLQWWFVPSTMLAQADSCVGSKTSINFEASKNLVGSYYPPHEVVIDAALLETLRPWDYWSGLGEVVKVHCMDRPSSVKALAKDLERLRAGHAATVDRYIRRSLAIKLGFVKGDEFDRGRRQLLNYGHDFGHALEAATDFRVPHGIAVALGIVFANRVAFVRGYLDDRTRAAMDDLVLRLLDGYRFGVPGRDDVLFHLGRDKKREGKGLPMILSHGVGRLEKRLDVQPGEFARAWDAVPFLDDGWVRA